MSDESPSAGAPRAEPAAAAARPRALQDDLARGVAHYQAGRLGQAEPPLRRVLEREPDNADVAHLLGLIAARTKRFGEAEELVRRALALRPRHALYQVNLGRLLLSAGRPAEADPVLREAIAVQPDNAAAHFCLGLALQRQDRGEAAIEAYRRAVELAPDNAEAHNNLGAMLKAAGRLEQAVAAYRRAVELKPELAEAHSNLGVALNDLGRSGEAVAAYRRALEVAPDLGEAHSNLGVALKDLGRFKEAFAAYRRAIELKPQWADPYRNLGTALLEYGQLDDAVAAYRRAIALKPDHADAHRDLGMALLTAGRFEEGWKEYEWRWRTKDFAAPPRAPGRPRWDGAALAGRRILLHPEQGLGDTIQFARYAPLVAAAGGRVIVECQPPLVGVLRSLDGVDEVVAQGDPPPPFDTYAALLSLPRLLGTTRETIPATVPYLAPPPDAVETMRGAMAGADGLKVGLVWSANPRSPSAARRSLALEALAPLLAVAGVRFFGLQVGPAAAELGEMAEGTIVDLSPHLVDFGPTAAAVAELDLLISCDTSVAHVAGALARPVWVLVPFATDWRWLRDRDDTAWYPTMRLFRQASWGEWRPVIARLRDELAAVASGARARLLPTGGAGRAVSAPAPRNTLEGAAERARLRR